MFGGRIVEIGPVERVYAAPAHPYTRALLDAVPVPDPAAQRARLAAERSEVDFRAFAVATPEWRDLGGGHRVSSAYWGEG